MYLGVNRKRELKLIEFRSEVCLNGVISLYNSLLSTMFKGYICVPCDNVRNKGAVLLRRSELFLEKAHSC